MSNNKGNYNESGNSKKGSNIKSFTAVAIASTVLVGFETADYLSTKTDKLNAESSIEKQHNELKFDEFENNYLKEHAIEVTANEILNDYWEATTADEFEKVQDKYANKYLEVTGEVQKIKDESLEGAYILLENSETKGDYSNYMTVQCLVSDVDEIEQMKKIEVGDTVKITGYSNGSELVCISLYDCDIKDIER